MVKVDTLYQIDVRLREIKGVSRPFGGVSMILLGDPLQLRPVRGSYPWEEPKNEKYRRVHQIEPIWDKFLPVILRTNHRQGSDREFSDIVKLGSLLSHTEWSNISERNSNLIENLKKGPELTL